MKSDEESFESTRGKPHPGFFLNPRDRTGDVARDSIVIPTPTGFGKITIPTEAQIIDRLGSLSSASINRIIAAGNEITKTRWEDGVFE